MCGRGRCGVELGADPGGLGDDRRDVRPHPLLGAALAELAHGVTRPGHAVAPEAGQGGAGCAGSPVPSPAGRRRTELRRGRVGSRGELLLVDRARRGTGRDQVGRLERTGRRQRCRGSTVRAARRPRAAASGVARSRRASRRLWGTGARPTPRPRRRRRPRSAGARARRCGGGRVRRRRPGSAVSTARGCRPTRQPRVRRNGCRPGRKQVGDPAVEPWLGSTTGSLGRPAGCGF